MPRSQAKSGLDAVVWGLRFWVVCASLVGGNARDDREAAVQDLVWTQKKHRYLCTVPVSRGALSFDQLS